MDSDMMEIDGEIQASRSQKNTGVERMRSRVVVEKYRVTNTQSIEFPHNFPEEDLGWNFENFKQNFKIVPTRIGKDEMEFDMIGIDASIANAFRRIMIAEVPTMAIENVYVLNNTGIMHDEVLAHRMGLIPIKADPRAFNFRAPEEDRTDLNTIVFGLKVKCTNNPRATANAVNPTDKYLNSLVKSGMLQWKPHGDQEEKFKDNPIDVVNKDIVITKLRPDQEIDLELHCQKGIGKEHAKWSPVATASYRLLPEIQILKPITGADSQKFVKCFPKGVAEVFTNDQGETEARVVNARIDTVSREVLRHKEFEDKVLLTRVRDHFLFLIESVGIYNPHTVFEESVQILHEKCSRVKEALSYARPTRL
ncbi:DNA-directed RNA polymerase [Cladochytrium replicatum]|nr:DNA-directed RNA polymerase [Cladochytrium replicatum]